MRKDCSIGLKRHTLAKRLKSEVGSMLDREIQRAFELSYLREPTPDELEGAIELARSEGLPILCRALLNANEFVYLF